MADVIVKLYIMEFIRYDTQKEERIYDFYVYEAVGTSSPYHHSNVTSQMSCIKQVSNK